MVQLGVKYLPTIIGLFNSLTGGEGGPGIGGSGGGGAGGLLDLAANFLGGVTGNTKVETSAGVDPVKAQQATTSNVDRIDPTDLVKVIKTDSSSSKSVFCIIKSFDWSNFYTHSIFS